LFGCCPLGLGGPSTLVNVMARRFTCRTCIEGERTTMPGPPGESFHHACHFGTHPLGRTRSTISSVPAPGSPTDLACNPPVPRSMVNLSDRRGAARCLSATQRRSSGDRVPWTR
jgi:hypothetical protein